MRYKIINTQNTIMDRHTAAKEISAAYIRAINREMFGNYKPVRIVNLMRRIAAMVFDTPGFAIALPVERSNYDDHFTALLISGYLGYIQYAFVADDTLAVVALSDTHRAQILAADDPADLADPITLDAAIKKFTAPDPASEPDPIPEPEPESDPDPEPDPIPEPETETELEPLPETPQAASSDNIATSTNISTLSTSSTTHAPLHETAKAPPSPCRAIAPAHPPPRTLAPY